jgi:hypothetical protein
MTNPEGSIFDVAMKGGLPTTMVVTREGNFTSKSSLKLMTMSAATAGGEMMLKLPRAIAKAIRAKRLD